MGRLIEIELFFAQFALGDVSFDLVISVRMQVAFQTEQFFLCRGMGLPGRCWVL